MSVFETKNKHTSVEIAKDRIKALLVSDRVNCTPDTFEKLQNELFKTISKYIEIVPEEFEIKMTNSYIYIRLTGENS